MFRLILSMSMFFVLAAVSAASDTSIWQQLNYDPGRVGINYSFVLGSDSIVTLGNHGTIRLYQWMDESIATISGDRFAPNYVCGGRWENDSIMTISDIGDASIVNLHTGAVRKVAISSLINARSYLYVREKGALVATKNGVVFVPVEGTVHTVLDGESTVIASVRDTTFLAGDTDGRLRSFDTSFATTTELYDFGSEIFSIVIYKDSVLVLAGSSVYVSSVSSLKNWRMITSSLYGGRSLCVHTDTIVASTRNSGETSIYLSGDWGSSWVGGGLSSKSFPECDLLETNGGVFAYGSPGFYRFARTGMLYDAKSFSQKGFGVGPPVIYLLKFSSIDRWDERDYLVVVSSLQTVMRSVDSAKSWRLTLGDSTAPGIKYHWIRCFGDSEAIVVGEHFDVKLEGQNYVYLKYVDLFRTRDRGDTWKHLVSDRVDYLATRCEYLPSGEIVLWGGRAMLIVDSNFSSLDTLVFDAGQVSSVSANREGVIVAAGATLGVSLDKGMNWQYYQYPSGLQGVKNVVILDNNKVVVTISSNANGDTDNYFCHFDLTTKTWSRIGRMGPTVSNDFPIVKSLETDGYQCIAAAAQSNRVYLSVDAGNSWVEFIVAEEYWSHMHDLVVDPLGRVVVCGDAETILGANFTVSSNPDDSCCTHVNDTFTVMTSHNGIVVRSDHDLTGAVVSAYTLDGRRLELRDQHRTANELSLIYSSTTSRFVIILVELDSIKQARLLYTR